MLLPLVSFSLLAEEHKDIAIATGTQMPSIRRKVRSVVFIDAVVPTKVLLKVSPQILDKHTITPDTLANDKSA
jgi:hypothetical protein